jgi:hypothetical protein
MRVSQSFILISFFTLAFGYTQVSFSGLRIPGVVTLLQRCSLSFEVVFCPVTLKLIRIMYVVDSTNKHTDVFFNKWQKIIGICPRYARGRVNSKGQMRRTLPTCS